MKPKFNEKKCKALEVKIKELEIVIDKNNAQILSSIKKGSSELMLNAIVSNRNSLSVDLDNLQKQLRNIKRGGSQYGNEIGTKAVRHHIDLTDY